MGFQADINSILNTVIGGTIAKKTKETSENTKAAASEQKATTEAVKSIPGETTSRLRLYPQQNVPEKIDPIPVGDISGKYGVKDDDYNENYGSYGTFKGQKFAPYDFNSLNKSHQTTDESIIARKAQSIMTSNLKETLKAKKFSDIPGLAYSERGVQTPKAMSNASQSGVNKNKAIENIQEPYIKGGRK